MLKPVPGSGCSLASSCGIKKLFRVLGIWELGELDVGTELLFSRRDLSIREMRKFIPCASDVGHLRVGKGSGTSL